MNASAFGGYLALLERFGAAMGWLFLQTGGIALLGLWMGRHQAEQSPERLLWGLRGALVSLLLCPLASLLIACCIYTPSAEAIGAHSIFSMLLGLGGIVWGAAAIRSAFVLRKEHRDAAHLAATASPVGEPLREHIEQLAAHFGTAAPACLQHAEVVSPVLVGLRRQVLLIPAGAEPAINRRATLVHFLAHVQRGEVRWLFAGRCCEVVFIAQPLVPVLVRAMQETALESVDKTVLRETGSAGGYVRQLMEVANRFDARLPGAAAGTGMKAPGRSLTRRILRLQDARPLDPAEAAGGGRAASAGTWTMVIIFGAAAPYIL